MKSEAIKYSGGKDDNAFSGEVMANLPENLEEAKSAWGEEVCLSKIIQAITIDIQRICRSSKGDDAKAQAAIDEFVPGVTRARSAGGPSLKVLKEKLGHLDPADLEDLIREATARAAAKG